MERIGFIGLGHMGNPMVRNLLKAGYPVKVFDLSAEAIQHLVEQGAVGASSVKETVREAEVVFTMLQTGDQVKKTMLNPEGVFAHVNKNTLIIDCSSINISDCCELHEAALKEHLAFLDAPVSGGVKGAEAATLTVMVGGESLYFERAKPFFSHLGKKIFHVGKGAQGQVAKICNNLILGISMIAVSEGFTLAENLGMDPKIFFEVASTSSSQCWSMTSYCPIPNVLPDVPSSHQYKAGFTGKMMLKDLLLALHAAKQTHSPLPLGKISTELYQLFVEKGFGELDFSGIVKLLKEEK